MKSACFLLAALVSYGATWKAGAESPIPEARPAERYKGLAQRSPFALATAAAPAGAPQASFAANWFVTGIGRIGDVDIVSIQSRDLSTQFSLRSSEPDRDRDVSLVAVNWSNIIGKSTVTLRKGNETARVEFNEALVRGPAPTQASAHPSPAPLATSKAPMANAPKATPTLGGGILALQREAARLKR